jgi:tetratricopeptide (TPR) repeat protein
MKLKIFITGLCLILSFSQAAFSLSDEEEKFYVANKAFLDGFYKAALTLFDRFIDQFPESKKVYDAGLFIAKCHYFREEYLLAEDALSNIIKEKEAANLWGQAYYWLGEIHFKAKNFKDSLKCANQVIDNYSDSEYRWWTYYLAANNYVQLGNQDEIENIFKKIIAESNTEELIDNSYGRLIHLYFQKKNYPQLFSLGQNYLKDYPKGNLSAKIYYYLGESSYAHKKFDEAIDYYQRALKINKEGSLGDLIYQGLGFSYLGQNNEGQAKKYVDKIEGKELSFFSKGVYHFKIKNYSQALEKFNDFLAKFRESKYFVTVYLNKADTLYEMGRVNDALSAYRYILNNFRGSEYGEVFDKALYGIAWCYLKTGEFKKAIEEFENTLKWTDNPIVKISSQIQIADAYQEAENYEQALDIYNTILKNNPNSIYTDYIQFQIGIVFLKTERLDEALLVLRNLKDNFPSSRLIPQAQYYLAVGYFSKQIYGESRALLSDFIERFPQNELVSKAYYLYGKCFFNEEEYSRALECFEKAIGQFKDNEIEELVYIDMGNAYLNLSLYDRAKWVWEDFFTKFPHSQYGGSISLFLGGLYEKEDDFTGAEKYYKKVLTDFSQSSYVAEAMLSLGHLYWQKGDLDKAGEYFEKLSSDDSPFSQKAKLYLAKVYTQRGENNQAIGVYDELIKSDLDISKGAILEKAFLLKEMKDYSAAIISFEDALGVGMDSARVRFSLAMCLEKINKNEEAIDQYFKVIYAFKDSDYRVKSYFRIGRLYEKASNNDAAKEIYEKIAGFDVKEAKIAKAKLKKLAK